MSFKDNLKTLIKAKTPFVYIETSEWGRLEEHLAGIAKESGFECQHWNSVQGLQSKKGNGKNGSEVIGNLVKKIVSELSKECSRKITVIEDAEYLLRNPDIIIRLGVLARELVRHRGKHQVILVSPALTIPSIIQREIAVLSAPLPKRDEIKQILNEVDEEVQAPEGRIHRAPEILDAVRGLGTTEIRNAFAKVFVKNQKITADEISELVAEKEQIIRKSGYLEFVKTSAKLEGIGGLENLKEWLKTRKVAFGHDARKKHLSAPKGVLLLGIPGTGKSLSAKAVAAAWNMPLLRMDMGRVFAGLVGESEANMRNALKTAESMAPCVLWIDEIEKGLGSAGGERDGGTSARVFGEFLNWMQEKEEEIFIFATANNVKQLPPELLRKGRFDEIFFVDLPGEESRKNIFKIHLKGKEQNENVVTDEVIKKTKGFSGAEIESVVNEALFTAISEHNGENEGKVTAALLCKEAERAVPLSSTMACEINDLRKMAKNRFRMANLKECSVLYEKSKETS